MSTTAPSTFPPSSETTTTTSELPSDTSIGALSPDKRERVDSSAATTNTNALLPNGETHVNTSGTPSLRTPKISINNGTPHGDDGWGSNFWVTLVDPGTQVSFYACPATGEVSWDPPIGNFLLPPSPEGEWWEMIDESSRLPYYYQTKTGETVWERPEAFVIPLGILQNTALGRRLSINQRNSIVATSASSKRSSQDRISYRRSQTTISENDISRRSTPTLGAPLQSRRSQSSTRGSPGRASNGSPASSKKSGQSMRKSVSNGDRSPTLASQVSPLSYQRGHALAPIPGSPYSTDHSPSPPPTPVRERKSQSSTPVNGRSSTSSRRGLENEKDSPSRRSTPRRTHSSRSATYHAPQPQSLNAALEKIALSSSQSSRFSEKHSVVTDVLEADRSSTPSSRARTSTEPATVSFEMHTQSRKEYSARSAVHSSAPARNNGTSDKASQYGSVRGKQISAPILDEEATMSMSPVMHRAEGRPIPVDIYRKTARPMSSLNPNYPALPLDLASDIMQFSESQFAKQYFSVHRTGFIFRRTVPVEEMMVWQKVPLSSPLLLLNRALHKEAVKVFKSIQRIMGDRERERPAATARLQPSESQGSVRTNGSTISLLNAANFLVEEERSLLSEGLTHGELRDEIYCQLMKQLTKNPNTESLFKGWQLMCVLLVTFPPSKNFETELRMFIHQATKNQEGRVDIMAKYCLRRLAYISKKGPRGKVPTAAEIETAVDAAFHPSIFGETLDGIFRLQERNYPEKRVPIILPFLADGILALGGTKAEGIFRVPGDGDSVSELKLRIDKGYYNLDDIDDPHVLASLLKLWLRELCDPLIPEEMYNDCIQHAREPDVCVQIVQRLPTINRRVVLFVISFLQLFLEEKVQTATKMTAPNLALVMAPNLLRCNSDSMTVVFTNAQFEQNFVYNLLVHLDCRDVDPDYVPTHGQGTIAPPNTLPRTSKPQPRRRNY